MPNPEPQSLVPNPHSPPRAMILAAGEGTRLRPLTIETPKPLLPIGGIPLMEHMLLWLRSYGIREVAINLHHLGDKIAGFVGDGSRFGMKAIHSRESELLGTAGGVKAVEDFFDSTFVVCYGDNLFDFDLGAMLAFHHQKGALVTMALFSPPNPAEVGIVQTDREARIVGFMEKPEAPICNVQAPVLANAAIYILERKALEFIPGGVACDFGRDVFPKLISAGAAVYGYPLDLGGYFIDIGTPEKYHQANVDVRAGRIQMRHLARHPTATL